MINAVRLFGMRVNSLTMQQASAQVIDWCAAPRQNGCRYVVTPNVDHVVMYQHHSDLRSSYEQASLVLPDGAPVVWASRLLGRPLPERVAGSDLVPAVCQAAEQLSNRPLRTFLLGAAPGVAEKAAGRMARDYPAIDVVGTCSPPPDFENDEGQCRRILEQVARAQPDLLIVGLGAPKQELWVARHHEQLEAKVALCVGATIDFLAGHRRRSPLWMRRVGLEWLHRVLSEPRRLASRYARDAWVFPQLLWREYRRLRGQQRIA